MYFSVFKVNIALSAPSRAVNIFCTGWVISTTHYSNRAALSFPLSMLHCCSSLGLNILFFFFFAHHSSVFAGLPGLPFSSWSNSSLCCAISESHSSNNLILCRVEYVQPCSSWDFVPCSFLCSTFSICSSPSTLSSSPLTLFTVTALCIFCTTWAVCINIQSYFNLTHKQLIHTSCILSVTLKAFIYIHNSLSIHGPIPLIHIQPWALLMIGENSLGHLEIFFTFGACSRCKYLLQPKVPGERDLLLSVHFWC